MSEHGVYVRPCRHWWYRWEAWSTINGRRNPTRYGERARTRERAIWLAAAPARRQERERLLDAHGKQV